MVQNSRRRRTRWTVLLALFLIVGTTYVAAGGEVDWSQYFYGGADGEDSVTTIWEHIERFHEHIRHFIHGS